MSGLFEMVAAKKDGAILRSLEDKTTRFVAQRAHNYSQLNSTEVYTVRDNVMLSDVFIAMQSNSEQLPIESDAKAVRDYFEKVYPDMDFDRVYASDMKKMVKWFKALKANNVEIKQSQAQEEHTEDAEAAESE